MDTEQSKIFRLKGKLQKYAWGGRSFIPGLLGFSNKEEQPFAEYWLGAHHSAPSGAGNGSTFPLDKLVEEKKEEVLGEYVSRQFGRLPYLLKVLDVRDMLSIQVHPSREAAAEGFAKENITGVPLDAPHRNYKDDNHKPELMAALGDFWLLHGFKAEKQLNETLLTISELDLLQPVFQKGGYEALYRLVMEMPQEEVNKILQPLLDRIIPLYNKNGLQRSSEHFWAARAALSFNEPGRIDRGIFSIYFFNLVHLKKYEAIFQAAGIPHAYLEGQNVEIMANSDNVLRGGLTNKHIDLPELMKHVKFQAVHPNIIHPELQLNGEEIYPAPAKDFQLSCFHLEKNEQTAFTTHTLDILLEMEGMVSLKEHGAITELRKGEAAMVFDSTPRIHAHESAVLFRATTPVQ